MQCVVVLLIISLFLGCECQDWSRLIVHDAETFNLGYVGWFIGATQGQKAALVSQVGPRMTLCTLAPTTGGCFFLAPFPASSFADDVGLVQVLSHNNVHKVEQNTYTKSRLAASPTPSWNLQKMDYNPGWFAPGPSNLGWTGGWYGPGSGYGVKAFVLDTGVDATHPEFEDNEGISRVTDGVCFDERGCVGDGNVDIHGHGTAVAGLIAGKTWGMANSVEIVPIRLANNITNLYHGSANPSIDLVSFVKGVVWAIFNKGPGKAVLHVSINFLEDLLSARWILKNALQAGIPVVTAAGNEGIDSCANLPGTLEDPVAPQIQGLINVGAIYGDILMHVPNPFLSDLQSNHGPCVTLYAPGENVRSAVAGCGTVRDGFTGTSYAAAMVTGLAVIYHQLNTYTPQELKVALVQNAQVNTIWDLPSGSNNRVAYHFSTVVVETAQPVTVQTTVPGLVNGIGSSYTMSKRGMWVWFWTSSVGKLDFFGYQREPNCDSCYKIGAVGSNNYKVHTIITEANDSIRHLYGDYDNGVITGTFQLTQDLL